MKKQASESGIWLKNQVKPYKKSIILLGATSVLASLLSVAFAYLTRFILNGEVRQIVVIAAALVAVLLARIAVRSVNGYLTEKYRTEMSVKLTNSAFKRTLSGKCAQISDYHSGELLNRITADCREIASDTMSIAPVTAGLITQFVGCLAALISTDPLFTAVLVVGGGLIFALSALFKSRLKSSQKAIMSADGITKSFIQESLVSSPTLKAYGVENRTTEKSGELLGDYAKKRVSRAKLVSVVNVLYSLVSNLGLLFAIVWCALRVDQLSGGYGSVLSIVLLMEQLQRPLTSFASVMPVVYARAASAERVYEIVNFSEEVVGKPTVDYADLQSIKFESVDFSYGKEKVVSGFNADIRAGKFTCIVGQSGVGKSTLYKLLLSLYTPLSGKISLVCKDGKEVEVNPSERALFAFVPQGNFLFSGSIRENLTFFAKDGKNTSEEKIAAALKVACAEFVYEAGGLDVVLKERGGGLSEGQLQRLAVARAVLSERPILLLDEATSALDEKTEAEMVKNLKNLDGRTCVMISHRPSTITLADEKIFVERG